VQTATVDMIVDKHCNSWARASSLTGASVPSSSPAGRQPFSADQEKCFSLPGKEICD